MAPRSLLFVLTAVGAGCAVILSVLLVGLNHRDQQKPISVPQVKLGDAEGSMPIVGLGVYQSPPGESTRLAILHALKIGYRHIDTAQLYRNEADVGAAIRESGIHRSQIFCHVENLDRRGIVQWERKGVCFAWSQ